MKKPSDERQREEMLQRIIGLGERSLKKSYYPELQRQIRELEKANAELQREIQGRKEAEEQRNKLEFQLRQSQKMEAIGTLAGGIAHDFNNILSAIIGFSELARIQAESCIESKKCLEIKYFDGVLRSADRAKQLVQQLLSFSRKQSGELEAVNLEELLTDTAKMLRAIIPTTISIETRIKTTKSTILADQTQIHQIIMNLGTNSYHAMQETGGRLSFELSETEIRSDDPLVTDLQLTAGPYLVLQVSDTGCGMDRETLTKIFNPYFSTKSEKGGTGLGLSVVHGIVAFHKGHISVYSEPGQGTTFRVYLPEMALVEKAKQTEQPEVILQQGHEHLLIVDDESALREVMQQTLELLGYTVTVAKTPLEALARFTAAPDSFNMLITDMNMPEMKGTDLIEKIRSLRQDLPVILCTGFSEAVNAQSTRALGHAQYIMKPVTQMELHKAIRSLFGY